MVRETGLENRNKYKPGKTMHYPAIYICQLKQSHITGGTQEKSSFIKTMVRALIRNPINLTAKRLRYSVLSPAVGCRISGHPTLHCSKPSFIRSRYRFPWFYTCFIIALSIQIFLPQDHTEFLRDGTQSIVGNGLQLGQAGALLQHPDLGALLDGVHQSKGNVEVRSGDE